MKTLGFVLLAAMLAVTACAPKTQRITIVSPPKTEAEKKVAKVHATKIFDVYHAQGLEYFREEIKKPEVQTKFKESFSKKIGKSDLGECLNNHGFDDYLIKRMLADTNPTALRTQIIDNWVAELPSEMLEKVDNTMHEPSFKKIFQRMRKMPGKNLRDKLDTMREEKFITEAEANEFFLAVEDKDMKAFLVISQFDIKKAMAKLLSPYTSNPPGTILEFMKTHPAASSQCSFLDR